MYLHVKVLQDSNKSICKVHVASGISCSLYNATQKTNAVDINQEHNKENPPICLCSQQMLGSFDSWKNFSVAIQEKKHENLI